MYLVLSGTRDYSMAASFHFRGERNAEKGNEAISGISERLTEDGNAQVRENARARDRPPGEIRS